MMCTDFFQPTQFPVQEYDLSAAIIRRSVPLVAVMGVKTAVMAVMRLTALVSDCYSHTYCIFSTQTDLNYSGGLSGIAIICQSNPKDNSGHLGHLELSLVQSRTTWDIQGCSRHGV